MTLSDKKIKDYCAEFPEVFIVEDVREAIMRIFQKLEKSIINGNKLNYTRTISIIKEEVGEELSR